MMAVDLRPWTLVHGASWLAGDGEVMPVPGFHEDWIRAHAELVEGAANVCEVVLRKGWISVTVYDGGYVELLVTDRSDPAVMARVERLLGSNRGAWTRALVMSMGEEGYWLYRPGDMDGSGSLTSS